jgi:hypothetical protein
MPLLFQYGSNCNAERLNSKDRLDGAAIDLGCGETIEEYSLCFNKLSKLGWAASDLLRALGTGRHAWGVLFEIPSDRIHGPVRPDGKKTMEAIEGRSYEETRIRIRSSAGVELEATTFTVKSAARKQGLWTSAEYVGHIVCGLRAHNVPEDYVQQVIDIALDTNRRAGEIGRNRLIEVLSHAKS